MPSQSTFSTFDRTRAAMLVSREPDEHVLDAPPAIPPVPAAFVSAVVALVASFAAVGALALVTGVFTVIGARNAA
jgi:hypothetical protein